MQFLQILFSDNKSRSPTGASTKCVLNDGSTSTSGTSGGFCLASDISTSLKEHTNFTVAHNVPVTNLQLLQITFKDRGLEQFSLLSPMSSKKRAININANDTLFSSLGAGAPIGAECISVDGSIAAIGTVKGSCLISDLIGSSLSTANIAFANNIAISGLQFFQATFGEGNSIPAPTSTKCVTPGGSKATAENGNGFCLVSDIISPTIGSANFSFANNLPITAWEFLQLPSNAGTPIGVVVSKSVEMPFDLRTSLTVAGPIGIQPHYFHLSDQTSEMEIISTPYWRFYPHIGLWVGL